MQDQEGHVADAGKETLTSVQTSEIEDWTKYKDDDIMQQQSSIQAEQAVKTQFVGDKEPLSSLEAEYHLGNSILLEKIKVLSEQYAALRRTRGDGNCFFRSFMFGYLEHILESQDQSEVHRIKASIEECKKTLQSLGYAEFTFEDFFALFLEQLDNVLQGSKDSISHEELLRRSRDPSISDYVVMFFRFVTSGEIRKRSEFFEPFILGLTNASVEQFCKSSVEPMGEESDHVQIIALSDALGVPIRVVYLDRSSCENNSINVNHHDFVPTSDGMGNSGVSKTTNPSITLLYRPGHYDILYPK
ncbi:OVARIAN TUMOR DOMAIN-containing deubiquitinating enzyme 1 [Nicotiana tabacum]|uniref:Ubiquitin thioesterase n=2 Tax=Nicotiana TaxID=4085 RepID=A0A1S4ARU0_TOBAC|nr:PREDICTED: ubiquitin thioesterase otubain-like [Nicotiana sylvestris]XP_016479301.1 PREDICTED: ubiquitin thioesterase otubain-like [Nicotiana tabacum]